MKFKKYRALVIEDENEIRRELVSELNASHEMQVVGEADGITMAYELIRNTPADVLFLDIKIIEGSSLDLLISLKKNQIPFPPIVITTGFRDFEDAKRIYNELHEEVILIMNKPFWKNWNEHKIKICAYLDNRFNAKVKNTGSESPIVLPDGRQLLHLFPRDIVAVKTGDKRLGKTKIYLSNHSQDCNLSLVQIMEKLPDYFMQISRYECINTNEISLYKQIERELVLKSGYKAIVGQAFQSNLLEYIGGL